MTLVILIIICVFVIAGFMDYQEKHSSKNKKYVHSTHKNIDYYHARQLWLKYEKEYFNQINAKQNSSSLTAAKKDEINKRIQEEFSNKYKIRFNKNVEYSAYISDDFKVRNVTSEPGLYDKNTTYYVKCFNDNGSFKFKTNNHVALQLNVSDVIHVQGPVIVGVGWSSDLLNSGNYSAARIKLEQEGNIFFKKV